MGNQIDVSFFEKSLKEEGLSGVEVSHYRDDQRHADVIRVQKDLNGEVLIKEERITDSALMQSGNTRQHMATLAASIAREFDEHLSEQHEWGENSVRLDLNEAYNATCFRCGAEASMDDLPSKPVALSETAVPQPSTEGYDSLPEYKLRLTLLALLKRECEPFCPNSPHDRKV